MTLPLPTPSARAALDLRGALHMALRCRMFDALVQVGRLDAGDAGEVQRTAHAVRQLLDLVQEPACRLHELIDALSRGPAAQRQQAAQALYDALAAWTAATLQRLMLDEAGRKEPPVSEGQRRHQWASLGDAELRDAMHWLGRALPPGRLADLLSELQALVGGERFALALDALGRPRHALPLAA